MNLKTMPKHTLLLLVGGLILQDMIYYFYVIF